MKRKMLSVSVYCLASGMMFAGVGSLQAGATEVVSETAETEAETVEADREGEGAAETEAASLEGELIFAKCEEYINVRSSAGTDSQIVAKLYDKDSATVLGQEGDWLKIQSGNASGYVKAEYFAIGEEAEQIADQVAYRVAVVHPEDLNIRTDPTEEAGVLGVAHQSEELEVVDYSNDWMKVALGDDVYGYVNAYYVDYKTYYPVGETLEEERARLETEGQAGEQAAAAEEESAGEPETEYVPGEEYQEESEMEYISEEEYPGETETEYVPEEEYPGETETEYVPEEEYPEETEYVPEEEYPEETEYVPEEEYPEETEYIEETEYVPEEEYPEETEYVEETEYIEETEYVPEETEYVEETEAQTSGLGQQIVDYALQFVGNPYVYGGTSLTSGADCSGFTQSVFANFGISLSRTAADQSYGGTAVDLGSIQPGDLLFYSDGSGISHVAIYMGGGQIVHAANAASGITTSNYDYSTPVSASRYW